MDFVKNKDDFQINFTSSLMSNANLVKSIYKIDRNFKIPVKLGGMKRFAEYKIIFLVSKNISNFKKCRYELPGEKMNKKEDPR